MYYIIETKYVGPNQDQELSSARDDSRFFGLDWIAKAENFEKILELKYHGGDA